MVVRQSFCKFSFFLLAFCVAGMFSLSAQNSKADRILGLYKVVEPETKEVSKVRVTKTVDGKYQGQVVWLAVPTMKDGTPKRDIYNPDPKKRNTPGNKIVLMWNFTYDAEKDKWVGGQIYDPCHGKTYKCQLNFENPQKLKVRGYIGTPALGKSMYWDKLEEK